MQRQRQGLQWAQQQQQGLQRAQQRQRQQQRQLQRCSVVMFVAEVVVYLYLYV